MIDSKTLFFKTIFQYYKDTAKGRVQDELLHGLSEKLSTYYFEQYARFQKKYPKSERRYSTFHTKDLDHPTTSEILIKFLKTTVKDRYPQYAMILLNMTESELISFEKNREEFDNMF